MKIKKGFVEKEDNMDGQLIWAKMRTHPYWPAKIVATPSIMGKTPENHNCVLFFGTKNFGFVHNNNILDYCENRNKFANAKKNQSFKHAVKDMDNYILDPVQYHDNAFVIPKDTKIKREPVKRRINAEEQQNINTVRIKTEPFEKDQITKIEHFSLAEKQKLIDKIIEQRSENERCIVNAKQTEEKCRTLVSQNNALCAKVCALSAEIDVIVDVFERECIGISTKSKARLHFLCQFFC